MIIYLAKIKEFWSTVASDAVGAVDQRTVRLLELMAPKASTDAATLKQYIEGDEAFGEVSLERRKEIWQRLKL